MTNTEQSQLVQLLQDIGLTSHESKTYIGLLQLGVSCAGPIVRKVKLHRQLVYSALDGLEAAGLVTVAIKNGRKNFLAADPEVLIAREESALRQLRTAVPILAKLQPKVGPHLRVHVSGGHEEYFNGMMMAVDSASRTDGIVRIIGASPDVNIYDLMRGRYDEYRRYCEQKKVKKQLLVPLVPSRDLQTKFLKERRTELRILEKGLVVPIATRFTKEVVLLEVYGEEPSVIQIWNNDCAKNYIRYFEFLWKTAKHFKVSSI